MTAKIQLLAVVGLAALAACPSDDGGPMNDTETSTGSDTGEPQTTNLDTTESSGDQDCGNGAIDGEEQCDGEDLGGSTCVDINPSFEGGTLGCGSTCTFDASACDVAPGTALVALNEITSEGITTGRLAGSSDAVELFNAGSAAADISGWKLSDDPAFAADKTYVFPAGTMLDAGAYVVLLSFDADTMSGELPFGLSDNSEETLSLADADGGAIDAVVVDGNAARVSYCRVPDGTGPWFQCEQTFGEENVASDTVCGNDAKEDTEDCDTSDLGGASCESLDLGFGGGVLTCKNSCRYDLDECTTDSLLVLNELSSTTDDIELFNGGRAEIDLSGWALTDDNVTVGYDADADDSKLVFPAGTTLAPGEYLVVAEGLAAGQHPFGLGAGGDAVTLLQLDPVTIIDRVQYGDAEATVSYCRQPNGPGGTWGVCTPSMGAEN